MINIKFQLFNSRQKQLKLRLYYQMNSYHYLFKFIVIGDTGVGKSCTVLQFISNKTKTAHDVTIGVEFGSKNIIVKEKTIKLQIWDTAGQQSFRSITRSYYRSAIGGLLVYDITRRQTFQHVKNWIQQVKANGNAYMEILLVGNKSDLKELRAVTYEEGEKIAQQYKLTFIQISARDYAKVNEAFQLITQTILRKVQSKEVPLQQGIGVKGGDFQPAAKLKSKIDAGQGKKRCC